MKLAEVAEAEPEVETPVNVAPINEDISDAYKDVKSTQQPNNFKDLYAPPPETPDLQKSGK